MTTDIAATETVVAMEIARLRMKVRENNVIFSPNGTSIARVGSTAQPGVSLILLGDSPKDRQVSNPSNMAAPRDVLN
jgi:hypothetical protein